VCAGWQVTVTGADLVKSGVGKAVTDLRKHADAQISSRAAALRAQWKAIMVGAARDVWGLVLLRALLR
jgi:hypothetical protein